MDKERVIVVESTIGIALLGRGTVGSAVANLLQTRREAIERCSGSRVRIAGVAHRNRDPLGLIADPRVDMVVEAIGGTGIALDCVEFALEQRKHVVTANKDAIATQGPRLRALAAASGVTLRYEAAVASAIPIVSILDEALAGDEVIEIGGVLSGTCNYMLELLREGLTFAEALASAQAAGYAEADPARDVEGEDAAHKLAILMQHAFGKAVVTSHIARSGIRGIGCGMVRQARRDGYDVKLVGYARSDRNGLAAQVAPVMVPFAHPFAGTHGVENAIRLVCASAGPLLLRAAGPADLPRHPRFSVTSLPQRARLRCTLAFHVLLPPTYPALELLRSSSGLHRLPVFPFSPRTTT